MLLLLDSGRASAFDILLDSAQPGRTFEGIGAVSAGASSRLLIDYPEPQRSQVLDYLFKPGYGASLQHLKVEIGGEVNSTDGTEPTHMRTRTDLNLTRGYEWWLLQQAKARNSNLRLDCLAWGAPGWIGNSNYYSPDMCNYIVSFLKGAQTQYGLTFDFTGTHNEAAVNASWIKLLRSTLDANGLQSVLLVAADEWGGAWNIVTNTSYGILVDPALSNAVARIGAHYPGSSSPASAQTCSQPLWASEDGIGGSTWAAARKLAKLYNRNYITGRMTKTEIWSPLTAYYDILPAANSGLMRANTPWSGNYQVAPAIWATAHTTQFAFPGWQYLEGGASALLPAGGSLVTLLSTNRSDYSVVVETFDATAPQTITFHLTNGLSAAALTLWQTTQTNQFIQVGQITPTGGAFTYTFLPECLYTLTTTTGQAKGTATPPPAAPFPLPFKEDFETYAPGKTPKYFSDQAGTFETYVRADGQGQCLRQVLPQVGLRWAAEWTPYSLIGESSWSDYDVSADLLLETNGGSVFVMGRVTKVPGFSDALPRGYWLALNHATSQWELHSASNLLAAAAAPFTTNTWHNLRLAMQGNSLTCFVDGVRVTNVTDHTYKCGLAGLGCGWHAAQFDNFTVRRAHKTSLSLGLSATAFASSVWEHDPAYGPAMANDGDPTTRWNTAYPTLPQEWLELDWPVPVTFNRTTYSQFNSRIFGYQLQHWNGSGWSVDVNGGTMGAFASDSFPAVTSTKVRLVLTNFTSSPSLYEFSVYADPPPAALSLAINEWMSANTKTLPDPAGGFAPWFELYNPGPTNVSLAGYHISSSLTNLFKFAVPAGYSIPAGGYLLVWADGQTAHNTGSGDLHVNFSLAAAPLIALWNPLGQLVDAVDLVAQADDTTSGSLPDGSSAVLNLTTATPRASNNQIWALPASRRAADGAILLSFAGIPLAAHRLLTAAKPNPPAWTNLALLSADALGIFGFADTNAALLNQRFYQAVTP